MSRSAYVDESEPDQRVEPGVYLLAATVVAAAVTDEVRDGMRRLLLPGQVKVHWNREPARHRQLVEAAAVARVEHMIVVRADETAVSERRRRICLERLLYELQHRGVDRVVLEARQARQNAKDVEMLNALRARRVVTPQLRIAHVPGPKEPLLWLPDIVAGAYGHRHMSGAHFDVLAGRTSVYHC